MIKKLEKLSADSRSGAELPIAVKDSAQQIWLAGLGAFAKAQQEGGKVFEALVKEGVSLQRKSQAEAEERLNEAAERITTLANSFSNRATGPWDKLETIFEERVGKALKRLGMPTADSIEELTRRVEQLTQQVQALSSQQTRAGGATAAATGESAKPPPARKRTVSRKPPQ